jgi:tol-pal system protein YbgF
VNLMPCAPRWRAALALCAALLGAPAAHAGLFDDEEARKAILEIRTRITQNDEAAKARAAELSAANAQLSEQVQTLRRSILDLNNAIESMRAELARLRGADEQLVRDVTELQKRQKDITQGIDDRIRKIEPQKVSLDGAEFSVEPEEKRLYEEAMATLKAGEYDKAAVALVAFQRRYPASGYNDSARFWLGNAYYGKRDYKESVAAFRAFVTASPNHPRAPEALLALANSQVEMKDGRSARKTIDELMKNYPKSEAAQAGKERLASIR